MRPKRARSSKTREKDISSRNEMQVGYSDAFQPKNLQTVLQEEMDLVDQLQRKLDAFQYIFREEEDITFYTKSILFWNDDRLSAISLFYSYPGRFTISQM